LQRAHYFLLAKLQKPINTIFSWEVLPKKGKKRRSTICEKKELKGYELHQLVRKTGTQKLFHFGTQGNGHGTYFLNKQREGGGGSERPSHSTKKKKE